MTDASAERGSSAPRYDFEEIDLASDSVHADVVRLVGADKRVLELGPATGYMTRVLRERGCTVVGIEIDKQMAERADEFCERVIVGDLDTLDLAAELGDERFDVIVAADVLEHLKDPLGVLTQLRRFLEPDGSFVISVPNVAHGSVRLALLTGHFDYRDIGLLDSTHLRFFTRESFEKLLDEAELGLAELHRHELNLDVSEVPFDVDAVPSTLRESLETDPDSLTYQFVVKTVPMEREGLREIQARLRELARLRVAATRVEELESAIAKIGGREGELRRALIDAHDQLLRRDAQIEELGKESVRKDEEIKRVHAELHQARLAIHHLWEGPYGRLYRMLCALPGVQALRKRKKAQVDERAGQTS
jgi:O-antigen biosynthesis protein